MNATNSDLLTARLFLRAVFPVMKVILTDDVNMKDKFKDVSARVLISAGKEEMIGAGLIFTKGELSIEQGNIQNPDISLHFQTVKRMNDMLKGKAGFPRIRGIKNIGLLIKIFQLLVKLMLLMPDSKAKTFEEKTLKVKMTIYMITTALSQYNKAGVEDMKLWTEKQPDRIYQFSVDDTDIAAYIRIKGGKSKAGRGFYKRRSPFVHFNFHSVEGALAILGKQIEFIDGVEKHYVTIIGAPEYSSQLNDFMTTIQGLLA